MLEECNGWIDGMRWMACIGWDGWHVLEWIGWDEWRVLKTNPSLEVNITNHY